MTDKAPQYGLFDILATNFGTKFANAQRLTLIDRKLLDAFNIVHNQMLYWVFGMVPAGGIEPTA